MADGKPHTGNNKPPKYQYEESYFTGSFHGAVGSFSLVDLERSKNWFWGWAIYLNKYLPITNGHGKRVLEIGCSIGGAANVFASFGYQVTATDISKYALAKAKKLSPHILFQHCDIEKQVMAKNAYDLVYAFEVLEHLKRPAHGIKNMFLSLKPGGYVICSTQFPYDFAFDEPTHISIKHPDTWQKLFFEAGFAQVKTFRGTYIPFLYRFSRFFSRGFSIPIGVKWVNSTVYIIGKKPKK